MFLGRNFEYDRALEIIEEEEYLEDVDFDDIRRLRRADVNYFEIYKKIGSFDKSVNVPKSEQKIDNWNNPAEKTLLTPRILKKKTGRAVPIRNDRPNYRCIFHLFESKTQKAKQECNKQSKPLNITNLYYA